MASREKRLKRQIEGLLKQANKHRSKIENLEGRKDTTHDYWLKEAERFEERAKQRQELLDKKESKEEDKAEK
jgi:hypothetical protein